jgi:hypothetical protein
MNRTPQEHVNSNVNDRPQFGLSALFLVVTLCAVLAWLAAQVGFVPMFAAAVGLSIGAIVGGVIGLPFGCSWRSSAAGVCASLASLSLCLIWWLYVLRYNSIQNKTPFPTQIPVHLFFEVHVIFFLAGIALLGAVPVSSVVSVCHRGGCYTVLWPSITCATVAFLGGITFFAYDVWCRRGFPQPPLPWPIALAIPLFAGSVLAAAVGFGCGLAWVVIRSLVNTCSRPVQK